MKPKVSVILPNYNHAPYLQERIDSILGQTFTDFELIILDDCSTDSSLSVLQSYMNHAKVSHCILNDTNSGSPFKQWQKGIALAQGTYIWIAESDDFSETTFLERTVAVLENSPKTVLVYTDSRIVDREGVTVGYWKDDKNAYFNTNRWSEDYEVEGLVELQNYLLYRTTINNASAVLFRKSVLTQEAYVDKVVGFKNVGDLFTYLYAASEGSICYIAAPLNNYRQHPDNLTAGNRKEGKLHKERLYCFKEIVTLLKTSNNTKESLVALEKAADFILKKNVYAAIQLGELPVVLAFLKKLSRNKIYTTKKQLSLEKLFTAYASNNTIVSAAAKKFLKRYYFKNLKYRN